MKGCRQKNLMKKPAAAMAREKSQARARQAARKGLNYHGDMAAAVYAAEAKSTKALECADCALEAARSAYEAADEAKKEASAARGMAIEFAERIMSLGGRILREEDRVGNIHQECTGKQP